MKKVIEGVYSVQLAAGIVCLAVFLIAVLIQIFSRYLRIPIPWTDDLAVYSFTWSVFMGAAAMVHGKRHFAFTSLGDTLTGIPKHILAILIFSAMGAFALLMVVHGMEAARAFWNHQWISLPQVKMGYTWLCIPIAGATMCLYLVSHIVDEINAIRNLVADQ
ncbi:MAG: TRAP transporter small permease subunit [Spirochaetaceae bacterium]|nr:MAG: TRAP transporter small permease subunit [Spirochaetaceae bacterium]